MLSNIIITIDSREQNRKRIGSVEMWGAQHNAIIEHRALKRCDYSLEGTFNGHEINLGIEAKSLSQFCSEDKKEIKRKLTESYDYYSEVGFFIETGNYEYDDLNGKKIIQIRAGPKFINGCSLSEFEGTLETLQASGIHVRQLRSEFQFPDSIYNLLTYITNTHELISGKNKSYPENYRKILASFPGIGVQTAKKLIEAYPNMFWLCSASEYSYQEVLGNKVGKNLYEFVRSHELETNEWKKGYHQDGTKIVQEPELKLESKEDDVSEKIKSAIIDFLKQYSEGKTAEEISIYFNMGIGDKDKEQLLNHIKELTWERKITNSSSGLFVLSPSSSIKQVEELHGNAKCTKVNDDTKLGTPDNIAPPAKVSEDMKSETQGNKTPDSHSGGATLRSSSIEEMEATQSLEGLIKPGKAPEKRRAMSNEDKKLGTHGISLSNGVKVTKSDPITPDNISNHTGTVLSPPPKIPDDTQGKTTDTTTLPSLGVQAKDSMKSSKPKSVPLNITSSQPLPANTINEADELFGKTHPDWVVEKQPGKMNLVGRLKVFLEVPRTLKDCTDEFCRDKEYQPGTIFEHIMRMKRDRIVTEFDNKTFVIRVKS